MLGWAIGFFVAAVIAAMFGFGVVASTFAGLAMILFWVFVGLTVVSLLLSLVSGRAVHADGHVSHGGPSLGGIGALALVAVAAILAYSWVQNDWSAERAGRAIDQGAAQITADASEALQGAGDRAENLIQNTGDEMREDAAQGFDRAQETVDADTSNETANN
jgi:uncharacterized membrane protein YtjA (UPF0391 family)